MHFSKTYVQLLASLPPDLQEYTIQYCQLKKVIHQIVEELSSHGLNPTLLHRITERQDAQLVVTALRDSPDTSATTSSSNDRVPSSKLISVIEGHGIPRVVYELRENSEKIEPQLRVSVGYMKRSGENMDYPGLKREVTVLDGHIGREKGGRDSNSQDDGLVRDSSGSGGPDHNAFPNASLFRDLQGISSKPHISLDESIQAGPYEVIIPLVWDRHFFRLLCTTLDHMVAHLKSIEENFMKELKMLASEIGESTHPSSFRHSALGRNFHASSPLDSSISSRPSKPSKSDLYPWREIFKLYIEAEIFEIMHLKDGGERSVEDSERRLEIFTNQVTQQPKHKFKLKQSRRTLETFLQLNVSILNIKKLLLANSEAMRKILKKRAKQTALPFPPNSPSLSSRPSPRLALIPQIHSFHLPRILVQAIGESLIPIIPQVDDYSCLICTNVAFKPIRLGCKHVFCVRCLVKMQKRRKDNCPMCRAPSVLTADRSNVDWGLMNFIKDWFPIEIREKLKVDEKEINAEQLAELGYKTNVLSCVIM